MRVRDQLVYLGRLCGRTSEAVGRRSTPGSSDSGSRAGRATGSMPFRTATSSASSSSPRWSTSPSCSSSTNRSQVSTRSPCRHVGDARRCGRAGTTVLFSSHQLDLVEDICEDVVIIDAGRVVRAGDLAELRAEAPHRFVTIRYSGAHPTGHDRPRSLWSTSERGSSPARRSGHRSHRDGRCGTTRDRRRGVLVRATDAVRVFREAVAA